MKRRSIATLTALTAFMIFTSIPLTAAGEPIKLPKPKVKGNVSVEAAITAKKTVRGFTKTPLSLADTAQLLWAANGVLPPDAITGATRRVIPSAGGLYPLEIFLVAGQDTVEGAPAGVYRYNPDKHVLELVVAGDKRSAVASAALSQMWLASAPAIVAVAGVMNRTTVKYGSRGVNYVFMEAGNANQNLYLQAEALGLRAGTVGAFNDSAVAGALGLQTGTTPLLLVAVGK